MSKSKVFSKQKIQRVCLAGILCALSLVLMFTVRFPIFPSAAFYEMEFADVPILICSSLLGPVYALVSLFTVCLIQALTVSSASSVIGFLMHFISSGLMIVVVNYIRTHNEGIKGVVISNICGIFVMTLVMIPMNMWMTTVFLGINIKQFMSTIVSICIAFNVIKSASNLIVYSIIVPVLSKEWNKLSKN